MNDESDQLVALARTGAWRFEIRTGSGRAAHAAARIIAAIENLEAIDAAAHAELGIRIDGRKVSIWVSQLSLGASNIDTPPPPLPGPPSSPMK